jgi:hypothetical protein
MEFQHINVKIFVDGELTVDPERFIPVFHRWVAEQSLPEMLIDVADYCHVPAGPGVVLIGHQADYALDHNGNRWGLLYNRKAAVDGSNEDRLRQSFRSAAGACRMLEAEFGSEGLRFSRHEFALLINDRALAPNDPETLRSCKSELEAFLHNEFGHSQFTFQPPRDARSRCGLTITALRPCDWAADLKPVC